MYDETISDVASGVDFDVTTEMIDLSELGDKASGAQPAGWYPAEVIEGFQGRKGEILTETSVSQKGDSFNLRLCFRVKFTDVTRTMFTSLNYRPVDFTPKRVAVVQKLREEFAGQRGAWEGFADEQRSSLALGKLGQLQTATGVNLTSTGGKINAGPFVGKKLFVYVNIDQETGYNDIKRFSQYANGVAPRKKGGKR